MKSFSVKQRERVLKERRIAASTKGDCARAVSQHSVFDDLTIWSFDGPWSVSVIAFVKQKWDLVRGQPSFKKNLGTQWTQTRQSHAARFHTAIFNSTYFLVLRALITAPVKARSLKQAKNFCIAAVTRGAIRFLCRELGLDELFFRIRLSAARFCVRTREALAQHFDLPSEKRKGLESFFCFYSSYDHTFGKCVLPLYTTKY